MGFLLSSVGDIGCSVLLYYQHSAFDLTLGKGGGNPGTGGSFRAPGNSLSSGVSFIDLLTTVFYQDKRLLSALSLDPT